MIAARLAMVDVMASYAAGTDRRDWALVESCFHPDAFIEGTRFSGSWAEYFPRFRDELAKFDRTVHFLGTQRGQVDGDDGWLETYAVARHFWTDVDGPKQLMIGVRYADDFHRVGDVWAITRRVVELDWSDTSPVGPGLTWTAGQPAQPAQPAQPESAPAR